jgi:tetratricopeptide (TPR) repeat protein
MSRSLALATLLVLAASGGPTVRASGSKPVETPRPTTTAEAVTPEQQAAEAYNEGLAYRDEAWKLTDKLEKAAPDDRTKLEGKIRRAYEGSIRSFESAVQHNPRMHQAYSSLGYAYRKTGNYTAALAAYDKALAIAPDYLEAVEYRGEAYLGLGRLDDAKAAWETLRPKNPQLASDLLQGMRTWIAKGRGAPGNVDVGTLDALERWVDERQAGQPAPSAAALRKSKSW